MTSTMTSRRVSLAENMKYSAKQPAATIGVRHVQALFLTLGFLCCYGLRTMMSVAVVAMTSEKDNKFQAFEWDQNEQSVVLSSFFWGYCLTQLPAGMLAQRWGAQRIIGFTIGLCALGTLAIPAAAFTGSWQLVAACRIFCGLCQGFVPPCIHTLLSKWVPLAERGRFTTFVYSGGWVGNVMALQTSGLLAASSLGWPSCFYFWGMMTLLWCSAWYWYGREAPSEHPAIPDDERDYIETSLGIVETAIPLSTPWKSILTSVPVWALLLTQWAHTWGFWLLLTKMPTYMSSVLKFDIKSNGLVSSLPYLSAWLSSFPISFLSDWAIRTNKMTTVTGRKLCNTLGELLPALALVYLGFVDETQTRLAVFVLILAVTCNIAIYCGHHVNHMDLSPNFAGPLMGFCNGPANISSIIAPLVTGWIVLDQTDAHQWRYVFFLTAGVYVFGALVFLAFGQASVQSWNDTPVFESKKHSMVQGIHAMQPIPEIVKEYPIKKYDEKIER